jgi:hypothetical protein
VTSLCIGIHMLSLMTFVCYMDYIAPMIHAYDLTVEWIFRISRVNLIRIRIRPCLIPICCPISRRYPFDPLAFSYSLEYSVRWSLIQPLSIDFCLLSPVCLSILLSVWCRQGNVENTAYALGPQFFFHFRGGGPFSANSNDKNLDLGWRCFVRP